MVEKLEEHCLAKLLLTFDRNIIPFHEKTLTVDKGLIENWKQQLRDSECFYNMNKRCSIRCRWFSFCDSCDTSFCQLNFKNSVDGTKVYLCYETSETLCESCHVGCGCYEQHGEVEQTEMLICSKCGFRTDSEFVMGHHACYPKRDS